MDWQTHYSIGVDLKSPLIGQCVFKIPTQDGVHDLIKPAKGMAFGKTIKANYTIKPSAAVFQSAGGLVPKARLFFQRKGDTMSGEGEYAYYRFWSNPAECELMSGTFTLTADLKPNQWQSENGKMATTNVSLFLKAIDESAYVGLTFGDDTGFAHGVWVSSTGFKFKLNGFKIS